MKSSRSVCILLFLFYIAAIAGTSLFIHCDARRSMGPRLKGASLHIKKKYPVLKNTKKLQLINYLDVLGRKIKLSDDAHDDQSLISSNSGPYVSSPIVLPPFDSLAPNPLPENSPPYCLNTPSTSILTPVGSTPLPPPPPPPPPQPYYLPPILPIQNPPPGPAETLPSPNPPVTIPGSPDYVPSPTTNIPSPPTYIEPSPPSFVPNPPEFGPSPPVYYNPSPIVFVPSPPVFEPPVVYPPPNGPPPPNQAPNIALWCVAKPTVPDPIIQEAMNYACASGADCDSIQPNGSCFQPDTLYAHASYAFNSYWQRSKVAGGTCDFGGTAMLVTVDPSYDGCHFIYADNTHF